MNVLVVLARIMEHVLTESMDTLARVPLISTQAPIVKNVRELLPFNLPRCIISILSTVVNFQRNYISYHHWHANYWQLMFPI